MATISNEIMPEILLSKNVTTERLKKVVTFLTFTGIELVIKFIKITLDYGDIKKM